MEEEVRAARTRASDAWGLVALAETGLESASEESLGCFDYWPFQVSDVFDGWYFRCVDGGAAVAAVLLD